MGSLIVGIIILILGAIFNRMLKVKPLPPQQEESELDEEISGWSRLETIQREIENGGNREFVNSERGENAPPMFRSYNIDYQTDNAETDSSEKVLTDFSPDTYVFGSTLFDSGSFNANSDCFDQKNDKPLKAKSIAFSNAISTFPALKRGVISSETSSDDSSLMTNEKERGMVVNFNIRDAVIFSALLNPKFKEENLSGNEIII